MVSQLKIFIRMIAYNMSTVPTMKKSSFLYQLLPLRYRVFHKTWSSRLLFITNLFETRNTQNNFEPSIAFFYFTSEPLTIACAWGLELHYWPNTVELAARGIKGVAVFAARSFASNLFSTAWKWNNNGGNAVETK